MLPLSFLVHSSSQSSPKHYQFQANPSHIQNTLIDKIQELFKKGALCTPLYSRGGQTFPKSTDFTNSVRVRPYFSVRVCAF